MKPDSFAPHGRFRMATLAAAVLSSILSLPVSAASAYDAPAPDFQGRVFSPGALAGQTAEVSGYGFVPGQKVTLTYAGQPIAQDMPLEVGAQGGFKGEVSIPAGTAPGRYPIVVQAVQPPAALVYDLKVSPNVPLSGQDGFELTARPLEAGLYQVAYGQAAASLFVTSAVGRPPVKASKLLKVDPDTLNVTASVDVAEAPGRSDGHRLAVYGIAVDDARGNVWTTNTRDNTVAVYRQKDLALVKQFEPGLAPHARDVAVDAAQGKAYVSMPMQSGVAVFDAKAPAFLKTIGIETAAREGKFGSYSLALDAKAHRLYTVSGSTDEIAVIDTQNDKVLRVLPVEGVKGAIGVALDPTSQRLFVAAQGSDNVAVVDLETGKTLRTVDVGAGALNVTFNEATGHAYVSNRGAGTVTVLDRDGAIVANLPGGSLTNHAGVGPKGVVYVVNKARGKEDPQGDRITRIAPAR